MDWPRAAGAPWSFRKEGSPVGLTIFPDWSATLSLMKRGAWTGIALALVLLWPPALALDSEETAFLSIINDYRLTNGLAALALSPTLTTASELHSQDMADQNYFSHYSLDGRSPWDRMRDAGYNYATSVGENIAAGYVTAQDVFQAWKDSPGHNAIMLSSSFRAIGIGRAYNASSYYDWYWTADFGGYDDSGAPLPPMVTVTSPTHPSQDLWYANDDPTFDWEDVTDAEGYSFLIDHAASTVPDTSIDSTISSTAYSNLQDGVWYFHVTVKTAAGWGQASHYRVKLDCTPPGLPTITSSTHPDQGAQYPNDDPIFSWSAPFDTSGIFGYSYILDQSPLTTPDEAMDTELNQRSYFSVGEGTWHFHVRCVDLAGNWGSASHFRITVRFRPAADFDATPRAGYEPLCVAFTDLSFSQTGITNWSWDFGDGSSSQESNPVHLYVEEGNFSVSLTVWEADGDSDIISKTDYICTSRQIPDSFLVESVAEEWEPVIGATLLGTFAVADSYVSPGQPAANHGHETLLACDSQGSSIYLAIDLSAIPADATILDAGLSIYLESDSGLTEPELRAAYVQDDSWVETEICWSNAPVDPDLECDRKSFFAFTGLYIRLNISRAVRDALPRGRVTLRLSLSSGTGTLFFASRESNQTEARPLAVVQYAMGDLHQIWLSSVDHTGRIPNLGRMDIDGVLCSLPSNVSIVAGSYSLSYLPGYDFELWEAQGGLSVADALANSTVLTVWGPGRLVAKGDSTRVIYAFDDGTCEFPLGGYQGEMYAVAFSPAAVGRLTKMYMFFDGISESGNNAALVRVLAGNGSDLVHPVAINPQSEGWLAVGIDDPVDVAGDFFITLQYLNDDWPMIGVDMSDSASSFVQQGSHWVSYGSNLMIRCELEHLPSMRLVARLSIQFSPETPRAGELVTVWGSLEPAVPEAEVMITLVPPDREGTNWTVGVGSFGEFSFEYIPPRAGVWHVLAHWEGDSNCSSASKDAEIPVEKGRVYITCAVEPTFSHYGEPIRVMGSVDPVPLLLTIEYRVEGGPWLSIAQTNCSSNRTYGLSFLPAGTGNYEFRALWGGDEDFLGYETYAATHLVLKADSSITCALDINWTVYGSSVEISGTLSPACTTYVKTGYYQGLNWYDIATVLTREDGSFYHLWRVDVVGTVLVASSWDGDQDYNGAISEAVQLRSGKASATLSSRVEPSAIQLGEAVTIQGTIEPPFTEPIVITILSPSGSRFHVQAIPGPSGDFALQYVAQEVGTWSIVAEWDGNSYFESARSTAEFLVGRGSVELECQVVPSTLVFGDCVTILGSCSPVLAPIILQYARAGGQWTSLDRVTCSGDGRYECSWLPPHAGHYEFRAIWMGDERFGESASEPVPADVSPGPSLISVALNETWAVYGDHVRVSGEISPPCAAQVTLERLNGGSWNQVAVVPSTPDGRFAYAMQVDFVGRTTIRSTWAGNDDCLGASSEAVVLESEQGQSWVSCYAEPSLVELNQSVAIYGLIRPPLSVPIVVNVTEPEGTQLEYAVTSNLTGHYALTVNLSKTGTWYVVAGWKGNQGYRDSVALGTWVFVEAPIDDALLASLLVLLGASGAFRVLGLGRR